VIALRKLFHNVFIEGKRLFTLNLTPGKKIYGEKLLETDRGEVREWNPHRSKLAAAILNGLKNFPFKKDSNVLYLGAAQGTTASHVSDIVNKGSVVCVDVSSKAMEKLIPLCESRPNMIPVLADANNPGTYGRLAYKVNLLYQDVAQPNQDKIFLRNAVFLTPHNWGLLCVKSRSADVTKNPTQVVKEHLESVSDGFWVREVIRLEPFHKDHAMVVGERKLS
jgi:fibrillarin-like pre-rRNA processing protein